MLYLIRERDKRWIAWFIVGLISIPFALWGVNSYMGGPTDVAVAKVNGEDITQSEYQRALQMQRDQMRQVMGEQFDPALFDSLEVKRSVLEGLIEERLLSKVSSDLGQTVSNAQLSQVIQNTPSFLKDGKFDQEYYKALLARAGLSSAKYEYDLRNNLLNQEFVSNIQKTAIVTTPSVDNVIRLEKQSRDIAYGVIPVQSFYNEVDVEEENIRLYFESNKQLYTAPEQVSVEYVELSVDSLKQSINVDESTLKSFYADNEDQFVGPEQRRFSHILIEGDDDTAVNTITALKSRIDSGESFELVAKEASQDFGSADNGGDLGFITTNMMDAEFEEAAFALNNIGDVSEPVQTEFGYHLITLTEVQAAEGKNYSQAKSEVEELYKQREAEKLFYEKAEQLADLSYESPDSLDYTAEVLELEVKESQLFTRNGGSGIASDQKVINAAFSTDVLDEGLNSAVIERSKTDFLVLRKKRFIEETLLPFDSVAPAIEQSLRFEKMRAKAEQAGEDIIAKIADGVAAETLFDAENWHVEQNYQRGSDKISAQLLEQAFETPKPVNGEATYSGFTAENGNFIVVKVSGVQDGESSSVDSEQREALLGHLKRIATNGELAALLASIKAEAEIELFQQNL
jgi:peptidyl-prolyl cis-trans isomerase D